jgi:hypothetical protein
MLKIGDAGSLISMQLAIDFSLQAVAHWVQ